MRKRLLGLILTAWLLTGGAQAASSPFWADFVAVGAGDCILLGCDGEVMMVDTGPAGAWNSVYRGLIDEEVQRIDVLVVTHPHPDHAGNVDRVLDRWPVGEAWVSAAVSEEDQKTVIAAFQDADVPVKHVGRGDRFTLGSADVEILWPNSVPLTLVNDQSIVMRVTYQGFSILLMGDAEREAEMGMLAGANGLGLHADLIKPGHHGLATSTTYPFARAVSAQYAVVTCDKAGRKVTTAQQTMDTLITCGAKVILETGNVGTVYLEIDRTGRMTINTAQKTNGE